MKVRTSIRELSLGSVATIVGYAKAYGVYIRRLTALGLTPGIKFVTLKNFVQKDSVSMLF